MGTDSKIEWTDHTFNPWWGCEKVSAACKGCYAETFSLAFGGGMWGRDTIRRTFGDKHWREPERWNRRAAKLGIRYKVFCASMADVFEDREDLVPHRKRLWEVIAKTPNLDWLLLTKRSENVVQMVPWRGPWPKNVWLGVTVEHMKTLHHAQTISQIPAGKIFLSMEPLLEHVDLSSVLSKVDWVIVGGQTGSLAKPMSPDLVRGIRDQCVAAGVPFLFKQWGDHGADGVKRKKKENGRELDGRTWTQFP